MSGFQVLAVHAFSMSYAGKIGKRIDCSLGCTFAISSESEDGVTAFLKTSYDLGEKATLNLEVETSDDASFSRQQKYLVYLSKYF